MGRFGRTGARVGVWAVGLDRDGGGHEAQLAGLWGLLTTNSS
jgi:hypothetical protein